MTAKHINALRAITTCKLIKMPQLLMLVMASKQMTGWTMSDLTAATGARPSVVTMAKNKLTQDGLVVEHFPQRDRRVTKVYLTDEGRSKAGELWNALRALSGAEKVIRSGVPRTSD